MSELIEILDELEKAADELETELYCPLKRVRALVMRYKTAIEARTGDGENNMLGRCRAGKLIDALACAADELRDYVEKERRDVMRSPE